MAFFETRQAQGTAKAAKTDAFSGQLEVLETRRKEAIFKIGELYLENTDEETAAGTVYEEFLRELKKIEAEKDVLEKRKLAAQGMRKCGHCGHVLALNSVFCNMCGEKLAALFVPTAENPHICVKCGTPYDEDTLFCTVCGTKLA